MSASVQSIALVCLTPVTDANELGTMDLPSYGIKRIQAAVVADPALAHCSLHMIDIMANDVDAYVAEIEACEPDLIGFSMYVWSTMTLIEVARRIKLSRPDTVIIFGGPSARTQVFDLPIYPAPVTVLDAVVASEGEEIFTRIAKLPDLTSSALKSIPGLSMPLVMGWYSTGLAEPIQDLDNIASAYQLGLMPQGVVAYLETFRGCPLSCRFCEWGASDGSSTIFTTEYLVREFQAYDKWNASSVFVVDAGLNLNAKAFKNLVEAEKEVGFLKRSKGIWAEIYPTNVRDQHLEFLQNVGVSYLGVGLQSLDPRVLKDQDRHFSMDKFESSVRRLAEVANCEVQIIMGLPGDTPQGFRRTLEFALSLPVAVRTYHCLVLPDAFLTRSKAAWNVRFDPASMAMTSCLGWSEEDFVNQREYNNDLAQRIGGTAGDYWWFFPRRF